MKDILFTGKENIGISELKYDIEYRYIPDDEKDELIDFAWEKGEKIAISYKKKFPDVSAEALAEKLDIKIVIKENGPELIFSEYYSNRKVIILYKNSIIKNFISQNKESLSSLEFFHVKNIFIMHEIFHHLECHEPEIGLTYLQRKVMIFSLGPFKRKVGLKSLSEIAAHSFTRRFLDIKERY